MHMQIDLIDAQINKRPDGSVEIHGQRGYFHLNAEYAKDVWIAYESFFKAYPQDESLKIAVNIEIPQPSGQIVNEN
jgi:hypothetical protein